MDQSGRNGYVSGLGGVTLAKQYLASEVLLSQ